VWNVDFINKALGRYLFTNKALCVESFYMVWNVVYYQSNMKNIIYIVANS